MNNYEAAELVVVGSAQQTILGMKELPVFDNVAGGDNFHRTDFQIFEE